MHRIQSKILLINRQVLLPVLLCCLSLLVSRESFSQKPDTIFPDTIQKVKPVTFHGSIGLNLVGYGVSGIPGRADPFSGVLSANATLTIYNIEIPFSFALSGNQKSYAQSFNQFGISPRWKWITLHGGYRNITFSDYTLAGHTFLGAGIELTPGIFRFGFIWGRFERKTTTSPVFETDSLPHFARRGFAVKVGVGSEKNFVDLILLRIHDDSTSLKQPDSLIGRSPEQNVVAGINTRFTITKKLVWETEGAVSLYTTNMKAATFEDIENNSTLRSLNRFFGINQSTEYFYAIRSSLRYMEKYWSLKLEYKRIEPNYRSMGAYFFNCDLENFTIQPTLQLFKRKLIMSGGLGFQRDNLWVTKKATSYRTIGNANISWNPISKFGINASYSNYTITQTAGRLPLIDSTMVTQATHNLSASPRLLFINRKTSHMIMAIYNLAMFIDKNRFKSEYTQFTNHTAMLLYTIGLLPSRWSLNIGATCIITQNYLGDQTGIGGSFGVSKALFKDKLSLSWNNSLMRSNSPQLPGWTFNSNLIALYMITSHHSFRFNIYLTGNQGDPGSVNTSFNELKGDLTYVYTF